MARPKKAAHEQRGHRFNLRLTAGEIASMSEQAALAGLTAHEFARRRALGWRVQPANASRRCDPALISELNRIGVNLNQLTRATHLGKDISGEWEDLASELKRALEWVLTSDGS